MGRCRGVEVGRCRGGEVWRCRNNVASRPQHEDGENELQGKAPYDRPPDDLCVMDVVECTHWQLQKRCKGECLKSLFDELRVGCYNPPPDLGAWR